LAGHPKNVLKKAAERFGQPALLMIPVSQNSHDITIFDTVVTRILYATKPSAASRLFFSFASTFENNVTIIDLILSSR